MVSVAKHLRRLWSNSAVFRISLVVALIYGALRLAVHGAYLALMLFPQAGLMGGMPGWTGAEGEPMVPVDLQVYLDAAENLLAGEDLYIQGTITRLEELYQYTPAFALAFVPFRLLCPVSVSVFHTVLHMAAYAALYLLWAEIFDDLDLKQATRTLALALPVWLLFSAFWSDLGYLNIYVLMALLATLLIRSAVRQELAWSVLWTTLILQTKPQWAFAATVPWLLGHTRFFARLIGWSILAYGATMGLTMIAAGPAYVAGQYGEYLRFLWSLPARFPWRAPEAPFLGYNHSIKQVAIYLFGESPGAVRLATIVKLVLLAPLGVVSARYALKAPRRSRLRPSRRALELAFALYLGAFIWLDMVWELTLGIAIFTYLLGTVERPGVKRLVWAVFLPYALIDFWQLLSLAVFGMDVIEPGPYVLTDLSIYVPLVMVVILVLYAILLSRLWKMRATRWEIAPW